MGAEYELLVQSPTAVPLGTVKQLHRCTYACGENVAGEMALLIPPDEYDPSLYQPFGRILVQRQVGGVQPYIDLNRPWIIIDGPLPALADDGTKLVRFECLDPVGLILDNRIIPYNDYTSYTQKNAAGDDMLKALARENFGALATDTRRDLSGWCNIAADVSAAPTLLKYDMAWRNLLDVMVEVVNASANDTSAPTWLGFDIVLANQLSGLLEFRTYTGQRGVDRRVATGAPLVLSPENGNLGNVETGTLYRDSASIVYAAGAAVTNSSRPSATSLDTTLMALSPFAWMEKLADGSQISDASALQDLADSELRNSRPVKFITGQLVETEQYLRGVHYDYGDLVPASYETDTFDVRLDKISVTLEPAQGGGLMDTTKVMLRGEARV